MCGRDWSSDVCSSDLLKSVSLGEPYNTDFNGPSQRGVGFYQFTNRNGRRSSTAYAFLEPLRNDPRLTIKLQAAVDRIIVENGRAVGVSYTDPSGTHRVNASAEIILAAGALVSPKILMLSGIGPADHLGEFGIEVHADMPGVGPNLIDQPEVPIPAYARGPHGYYRQGEGWRMLVNGLQVKLFGTGRITSAGVGAGAVVNPRNRESEPTIQAFCVPIVYLDRDAQSELKDGYGVTVTTVVVKPKSRGEVRLASDRKSTRLNSSHVRTSRMPSSA